MQCFRKRGALVRLGAFGQNTRCAFAARTYATDNDNTHNLTPIAYPPVAQYDESQVGHFDCTKLECGTPSNKEEEKVKLF